MRAVDTNVLVRLVTGDDADQASAAERFVEAGAWVSAVVLAETIWVLSAVYERNHGQIADAVRMLLQQEHLVLEHADIVAASLEQFEARPNKVSFTDCLIVGLARKAGHVPLGTFDRELGKLDGAQQVGD
jgi:predicted nucleic-acid-binding protein